MKLVISKAVVNGLVTRIGQLGFKFAVEFESATGEKINSNSTNPLSDIPLFHKIENVVSKAVTVTRGESEVTIDINDQLVNDYVDLTFNAYEVVVAPVVQIAVAMKEHMKAVAAFQKKWQEDPVEDAAVVILSASPKENLNSDGKELYGWKLTEADEFVSFSKRIINPKTLDDVTVVRDIVATRDGKALNVSASSCEDICVSGGTLQDTARNYAFPITLVKAVRAYYGVEPLIDGFTSSEENSSVSE